MGHDVLVTGGSGQLAAELQRTLGDRCRLVSRQTCDITSIDAIGRTLDEFQPQTLVNCAAYTAVDQAENDYPAAYRVNATGPRNLAEACAARDIHLIHLSTDYVFSGYRDSRHPWHEDDLFWTRSAYGQSKSAGEHLVLSTSDRFAVVRTCGLYGHHGSNFVKTMLRLSGEREMVRVVSDQTCTPTSAYDLAGWIVALADQRIGGLIHATNAGATNWADFARAIFDIAGRSTGVESISTEEFGAPAERPAYSVLDCSRLDSLLSLKRRHWRDALAAFLAELD